MSELFANTLDPRGNIVTQNGSTVFLNDSLVIGSGSWEYNGYFLENTNSHLSSEFFANTSFVFIDGTVTFLYGLRMNFPLSLIVGMWL
jgi:hypothetical protein